MRTTILISTIIGSLLTITITQLTSSTNSTDNQWVIGIHYLTLQDGVDPQEARNYVENEWFQLFKETPGMNVILGEPDRGIAKGDFVLVYQFDSKWIRDYYYPEEGQYGEPIKKVVEKYQAIYDKAFDKYFIQEKYSRAGYLMFARAK